ADTHPTSPYAGNLYVLWDRVLGDNKSEELVLVRSTDDGKTWSQPRALKKYPMRLGHSLVIGPDGALYLTYSFGTDNNEEAAMLTISHDGGQTFDTPRSILRTKPQSAGNFPRGGEGYEFAIDPRGKLLMAWGDDRNGDADIFAATSTDAGQSWSEPV